MEKSSKGNIENISTLNGEGFYVTTYERNRKPDDKANKETLYNNALDMGTVTAIDDRSAGPKTKINLGGLRIQAKEWKAFLALKDMTYAEKMEYIEYLINQGLDQILYENPSLRSVVDVSAR